MSLSNPISSNNDFAVSSFSQLSLYFMYLVSSPPRFDLIETQIIDFLYVVSNIQVIRDLRPNTESQDPVLYLRLFTKKVSRLNNGVRVNRP